MGSGAIDNGLFTLLRGDATLAGLVPGGWYRDAAPADATDPFGIVTVQATEDDEVMGGRAIERVHYLVKVVAQATNGTTAQDGADRVDALLEGGTIVASGFATLAIQRESRVAYQEADGPVVWQHRGGIYDVWMDVGA